MAQQPLETILLRQLASYLATPIWLTDADGNLVYYNEPAEQLLGVRFEEAGPFNAAELSDLFQVTDLDGNALDPSQVPVARALMNRSPTHGRVRFSGLDGIPREIEVTAIAVTGQGDRFLGVMATFWEPDD